MRILLLIVLAGLILLQGCGGEWTHPNKTREQTKEDCRACEAEAARAPVYKEALYDCMKAKNYQWNAESDATRTLGTMAIVFAVLIGLSLGMSSGG